MSAATPSALKTIRWGILGYARIARLEVLPALDRAEGCRVQALASRDPAKRDEARRRFNLEQVYDSYDELLRDPQVDAVYLPLPNSLHAEWTRRAAEAGKHVLCEKPLGLNAAEARGMFETCRRHGVLLMEAFMYRYTDRVRRLLEAVRSGRLGPVRQVDATFRFLLDRPDSIKHRPELGGGSLYDVGCYPIHFAGLVADAAAGAPDGAVAAVEATGRAVMVGGVDHLFAGVIQYASGLTATIGCGFNAHKRVQATIVGTEGVLEVPDTFFGNAGDLTLIRGEEATRLPVAESDRYRLEVLDFADAIRSDRPPAVGADESLRNAAAMDLLRGSLTP